MALGRQGDRHGELVVTWNEMPRSPGHVFYDRLQRVLIDAGFDAFAATTWFSPTCRQAACSYP
jgi:transposase